MKCRDCERAFQAVRIQNPPVVVEGGGGGEEDVYFCSWSVFPLAFSGECNQAPRRWSPISPLIACPKKRKEPASPRVFYDDEDDDDVYVAISDDDEVAVDTGKGKGKGKEPVVVSRPVSHHNHHNASRKRSGAGGGKSVGRLDLNVELSNDVEEAGGVSGRRESNREVDNIIEGIGFFEGLDEFLSSLPILSVVGDDKIKAT